jgi:hypothetical protein
VNRAERRAAQQRDGVLRSPMSVLEKRARVIAGLYNNSIPLGLGVLHFTPEKMSPEDALQWARQRGVVSFDYLRGRVIKCGISEDGELLGSSEWLYDRDNGPGAAKRAVEDGLTDPFYAKLIELCSGADANA